MAESLHATEIMTVAAARALRNDDVCFVGIGAPSAACNLARLTHAPGITLIYESGTIDTKPDVLPLSIGDGELCETALTTVSVPEMFRYWLQGGRITVGFLGGAQIDRFANLNTTVIGAYDKPKVRLPGGGGAPEIATTAARSSSSWASRSAPSSRGSPSHLLRPWLGPGGAGARRHDQGADPGHHRSLRHGARPRDARADRHSLHPGVTREKIVENAAGPSIRGRRRDAGADGGELKVLRDLQARTERAHGGAA